jgi:hypothetical protein
MRVEAQASPISTRVLAMLRTWIELSSAIVRRAPAHGKPTHPGVSKDHAGQRADEKQSQRGTKMTMLKIAILGAALLSSAAVFAASAPEGNCNFSSASYAAPEGNGNFSSASYAAPEGNGNFSSASYAAPEGNGNFSSASYAAPEGNGHVDIG